MDRRPPAPLRSQTPASAGAAALGPGMSGMRSLFEQLGHLIVLPASSNSAVRWALQ
ncbi:MAG: hypothetical protein R3F11_00485 [Verrucomicrobiales bacterium]